MDLCCIRICDLNVFLLFPQKYLNRALLFTRVLDLFTMKDVVNTRQSFFMLLKLLRLETPLCWFQFLRFVLTSPAHCVPAVVVFTAFVMPL